MHKSSGNDDKKLQSALKRIGVSTIPGIEEVNIFKEEEVVSFSNPKGEVDAQTKRRIERSKRATEEQIRCPRRDRQQPSTSDAHRRNRNRKGDAKRD